MVKSECKKCHKPLIKGNKCDACRQKEKDKVKVIGSAAVTLVGLAVALLTNKPNIKK